MGPVLRSRSAIPRPAPDDRFPDKPFITLIDTTTGDGQAMYGMLSVLAELQREHIIANTREGWQPQAPVEAKEAAGPSFIPELAVHVRKLCNAGSYTVQQIAGPLRTPRSTIYGHLSKKSNSRKPSPD